MVVINDPGAPGKRRSLPPPCRDHGGRQCTSAPRSAMANVYIALAFSLQGRALLPGHRAILNNWDLSTRTESVSKLLHLPSRAQILQVCPAAITSCRACAQSEVSLVGDPVCTQTIRCSYMLSMSFARSPGGTWITPSCGHKAVTHDPSRAHTCTASPPVLW